MRLRIGKFRPSKKTLLAIAGVLAVLAVATAAGVGLRMLQGDKNNSSQDANSFRGEPLPKAVDDAQNLRTKGDIKGAQESIDKSLADTSTSQEQRYMLYIQQGNAFTDANDYTSAIKSYEQANAFKQTYESTGLLAETWLSAGDKAKAVEYFKKSLPLIPDSPMKNADKARTEDRIRSLGGTL
jgi:tetratricopeptide (TPR) repeat protein